MTIRRSYIGYIVLAIAIVVLLCMLQKSRQRSLDIDKTIHETSIKK